MPCLDCFARLLATPLGLFCSSCFQSVAPLASFLANEWGVSAPGISISAASVTLVLVRGHYKKHWPVSFEGQGLPHSLYLVHQVLRFLANSVWNNAWADSLRFSSSCTIGSTDLFKPVKTFTRRDLGTGINQQSHCCSYCLLDWYNHHLYFPISGQR